MADPDETADPDGTAMAVAKVDPHDRALAVELLARYGEAIDAGDFAAVGALLGDAELHDADGNRIAAGRSEIEALYSATTLRHGDGTPMTSHVITNRVFTNTGEHGNFFALQLEPPDVVDDDSAVPRELVFVVDTSGSMNGRPMALSRTVMQNAIDAMRPQDTFNIITFAGTTKILWERPRPNTPANRTVAQKFIDTWEGAGGTEMMTAIETALRQSPANSPRGVDGSITLAHLADLPADGRAVSVIVEVGHSGIRRYQGTPQRFISLGGVQRESQMPGRKSQKLMDRTGGPLEWFDQMSAQTTLGVQFQGTSYLGD